MNLDLPPEVLQELQATFRAEALDRVLDMTHLVTEAGEAAPDADALAALFRNAHSLKGAAASLSQSAAAGLANDIEELLAAHSSTGAYDRKQLLALIDELAATLVVEDSTTSVNDEVATQASVAAAEEISAAEGLVRIAAGRLDRVIGDVGELSVSQTEIDPLADTIRRLARSLAASLPNPDPDAVDVVQQELQAISRELRGRQASRSRMLEQIHQGLQELRLEPLDTLFASMAREARRLARSMEFDLEVIVGGEDVIADRHVMNGLRQPLLHLVRNAVDHGLRNLPADRPAELTLRATLDGSHLVIEVRDNGRGIDLEAVANHAVAAGLDVERLTDQERADLVFHAGLSTRDEVSAMSGRGVGLGAVRAAAEALHGRAYIASTGQNGTCMKLQVPQRSASVPSLLLSVGQARVALATSRVDRVIDLRTTPPVRSGGADVVIVDGRPVALLDGGSVVSEPAGSRRWAVVVATPHGRQAMTVDAVSSGQNLVVRPLPSTLGELPGVTGAALTSDGSLVAVILTSLLVSRGKPAARSASTQDTQVVQSKQRRILVVDDSATTRTLIRTILSSSGHDVTTAADGQQARDLLRDHTFDLVVSDIDMPKLSGLELTKAIRATPSLRDLPVILVSARDSDSDRVESADAGADVHLSKGQFDQGELLRFTAELLP